MNRPVLTINKKSTYGTMWKSRADFQREIQQVKDQLKDRLKVDISLVFENYSTNKTDNQDHNTRLRRAATDQLSMSIRNAYDIFRSVCNESQDERSFELLIDGMFNDIKNTLSPDLKLIFKTAAQEFRDKAGEKPTVIIHHR